MTHYLDKYLAQNMLAGQDHSIARSNAINQAMTNAQDYAQQMLMNANPAFLSGPHGTVAIVTTGHDREVATLRAELEIARQRASDALDLLERMTTKPAPVPQFPWRALKAHKQEEYGVGGRMAGLWG